MKFRQLQYQYSRKSPLPVPAVSRVNYEELLKQLRFPLIWARDELLQSWIPAEADENFIDFVNTLPLEFDEKQLPAPRLQQLYRYGCIDPRRASLTQLQEEYKKQGFVIIKQLFSPQYTRNFLSHYYWRSDHLHERWPDMTGIRRTSVNNAPLMRLLHQATEGLVNQLVEEPVKTSYSFTSAYEAGSNLPAHTDRPQCKYNISLMLGSQPSRANLDSWPLFIERNGEVHRVGLQHGDAVLYSGTRDKHWRHTMPGSLKSVLGVFFHYVPADYQGSLD